MKAKTAENVVDDQKVRSVLRVVFLTLTIDTDVEFFPSQKFITSKTTSRYL
jgi:hypothetical protein